MLILVCVMEILEKKLKISWLHPEKEKSLITSRKRFMSGKKVDFAAEKLKNSQAVQKVAKRGMVFLTTLTKISAHSGILFKIKNT